MAVRVARDVKDPHNWIATFLKAELYFAKDGHLNTFGLTPTHNHEQMNPCVAVLKGAELKL